MPKELPGWFGKRPWLVSSLAVFVLGLFFVIVSPPLQVSDEAGHFYRAYQVGSGDPMPVKQVQNGDLRFGGYIDLAAADHIVRQLARTQQGSYQFADNFEPRDSYLTGEAVYVGFDNIALYSPLLYTASGLGVATGKALHRPVPDLFYLARLGNLMAFTLVAALGFYLLKGKHSLPSLLLLLPASLFFGGSISQDSLLIALAFLAGQALLALRYRLNTRLAKVCLFFSLLLLGTAKLPYIPLLLVLFLPLSFMPRRSPAQLRYLGGTLVIILITLAAFAGWYRVVHEVRVAEIMADQAAAAQVDASRQLSFLVHHPWSALKVFYNSNFTNFSNTSILEFFGMFGYWTFGAVTVPLIFVLVWLSIAWHRVIEAAQVAWQHLIDTPAQILAWLGIAGAFLAVQLTLYLHWTPVGGPLIEGLHGRYYLPVLLIVLGMLGALSRNQTLPVIQSKKIWQMAAVLLIPGFITLIQTFYI